MKYFLFIVIVIIVFLLGYNLAHSGPQSQCCDSWINQQSDDNGNLFSNDWIKVDPPKLDNPEYRGYQPLPQYYNPYIIENNLLPPTNCVVYYNRIMQCY